MPLDPQALRQDFPLLAERGLAYLDSAATAQKPQVVLDALEGFYAHHNAPVHRALYGLGVEATARYEAARQRVADFLGGQPQEVVFTRSATGALNLAARALGEGPGQDWAPGDLLVVPESEHHSNLLPWQQLAKRNGLKLHYLPVDGQGEIAVDELAHISGRVRVVAAAVVTNALGVVNPIAALAAFAQEREALLVLDAAQAAPHRPLDVQALQADLLALSAHKLGGPTGVGALWGRAELLATLPPVEFGGEMISTVSLAGARWARPPQRFEAGTPPAAEAHAFAAALDYLDAVGLDQVAAHEQALLAYALERLGEVAGVTLLGPPPARRAGVVAFTLAGVHPHDVAQILDEQGVCVRAGHHCAEPLHQRLGLTATTRASLWLYNDRADVDRLARGLEQARRLLG